MAIRNTPSAHDSKPKAGSAVCTSRLLRETCRDLILRAARSTKYKRIVVLSLGNALLLPTAAFAGNCTAGPNVVCSGPAAPGTDTPQVFNPAGDLTITADSGFGLDGAGIEVTSTGGTGDIRFFDDHGSTISAVDAALEIDGTDQTGELEVRSSGALLGGSDAGLRFFAGENVSSSTIDLNRAQSADDAGVAIENSGGALAITSSDAILGGTNPGSTAEGLYITNNATATGGIGIDLNSITSAGDGIFLYSEGAGDISIKASGAITSVTGDGIYVVSSNSNLSIDVVDVSGGAVQYGVNAEQTGPGVLSIKSSGTISGGDVGIIANSYGSGLVIETNNVQGGGFGIQAWNNVGGEFRISSTGAVVGTTQAGISATNHGTNLVIESKDVQSASDGIDGYSDGSGALRISSTGAVVGNTGNAVIATSYGTDLIIETNNTQGAQAITAYNNGSGDLRISSTGAAVGTAQSGISASNHGANLVIEAKDTQGASKGIHAQNDGSGELHIESTGAAVGTIDNGIFATNVGAGLVIDANDAQGGRYGIEVAASGVGTAEINVAGTATGGVAGVSIITEADTKDLNLTVNNASGGVDGIITASNSTSGNTATVTVTGQIAGGSGYGINTQSVGGTLINIDVAGTATVGATAGNAILNDDGASNVILASGATVNGAVSLGAGADALDLTGGFSGITVLDGGAGTDHLALHNADTSYDGTNIQNWDVFTVDNSRLAVTGGSLAAGAAGDATTGVFLTNGSTLDGSQGNFALTGNLDLAAGTTFRGAAGGTGTSSISGVVGNAGVISLAGGGAGDVLTIGGDYIGRDGTLRIDTVLGDDSAATDLVKIQGSTSGNTNVEVHNIGGVGAPTVAGIKMIEVAGASNGTFSLVGDYQIDGRPLVVSGAYGYALWKNGVANPTDGSWYLRSQLIADDPTDPVDPNAPVGPIYQPGVPVYEAYSQVLLAMNGLPTLQQRVGNRYWNESPAASSVTAGANGPEAVDENGLWTTIEGSRGEFQPRSSSSGSDYDLDTWRVRAGVDGLMSVSKNGKLIGSVTGHYGQGSSDISSVFGPGSISTDGYGLGAAATWYGNNGFYLDGQAQATWFNSDLSSDWLGQLASDNRGFGYATSLEGGRRVGFAKTWAFVPQAQLMYSNVRFDTFTDSAEASVGVDRADSLRGRLGFAIEHDNGWLNRQGELDHASLYGMANLRYEFLDGTSIDVSGTGIGSQDEPLWGEIGLGGSYNRNDDKYSFYGEISAGSSVKRFGDSHTLSGKVGLRIKW